MSVESTIQLVSKNDKKSVLYLPYVVNQVDPFCEMLPTDRLSSDG